MSDREPQQRPHPVWDGVSARHPKTMSDWDIAENSELVSSMAIARKFDSIKEVAVLVNTQQNKKGRKAYQENLKKRLDDLSRFFNTWDKDIN